MRPAETFEHARRRVFKGIRGRKHMSAMELTTRAVRRKREAEQAHLWESGSTEAAQTQLASNSLNKLCNPKQIAKRRARRMKTQPGRYRIDPVL